MKWVSIITGDIVDSQSYKNTGSWLKALKRIFEGYGSSPRSWDIFRGDSFQLEIKDPAESLLAAIRIKACVRQFKGLDVRMAIGIGTKSYEAKKITESNGEAFVHSGKSFEMLATLRRKLIVRSPWEEVDRDLNLMILLALIPMDRWTANSAKFMLHSLDNRNLSQKELGEKIGRKQSSVSEGQARANYAEITQLIDYYRERITEKTGGQ